MVSLLLNQHSYGNDENKTNISRFSLKMQQCGVIAVVVAMDTIA